MTKEKPMTFVEARALIRKPRIIPQGHVGPSPAMIRHAEKIDKERSQLVDDVILIGKAETSNISYFESIQFIKK